MFPNGEAHVTNAQSTEWMVNKLGDKFMHWRSQSQPFHVCLKVIQCIIQPMNDDIMSPNIITIMGIHKMASQDSNL